MTYRTTHTALKFGLLLALSTSVGCSGGGADSTTKSESDNSDQTGDGDASEQPEDTGETPEEPDKDTKEELNPDEGMGGAPMGDEEVLTAPVLLSSFPSDGQAGVLPQEDFTFEFDRPMDKDSVEASFAIEGLEAENYSFAWNKKATQLTVTVSGLIFAEGKSIESTVAEEYSLVIAKEAKSLDGEPMESKVVIRFTTARYIGNSLDPVPTLSGCVRSDFTSWNTIWTGDSAKKEKDGVTDAYYIGVLTFDLEQIAGVPLEIASATVIMDQNELNPSPYDELGNLNLLDVEFSERTYPAVMDGYLGKIAMVSTSAKPVVARTVLDEVQKDFEAGGYAQFGLAFDTERTLDGNPDNVEMSNAKLEIEYWVE